MSMAMQNLQNLKICWTQWRNGLHKLMRFFEVDSAVDAIMSAAMVAQGLQAEQQTGQTKHERLSTNACKFRCNLRL